MPPRSYNPSGYSSIIVTFLTPPARQCAAATAQGLLVLAGFKGFHTSDGVSRPGGYRLISMHENNCALPQRDQTANALTIPIWISAEDRLGDDAAESLSAIYLGQYHHSHSSRAGPRVRRLILEEPCIHPWLYIVPNKGQAHRGQSCWGHKHGVRELVGRDSLRGAKNSCAILACTA
ncbi:uncharacterized protein B0I36DRAFT_13044 [Microdochium trichocladiopsis]|uniref:Uncharacterized protein n=1 Tax=Microdochium trichocladiopsis TaxID=1682393 RepID=A0A9P8YHH6_9PEZI|nr:uncharacterized protein B0I36DRAFT_13044 [Microdochium trichocladiopsis]KAH7040611.1 hypothetical protein B0I36DRAFT_13044 [Microdochium trichocladiopsis]